MDGQTPSSHRTFLNEGVPGGPRRWSLDFLMVRRMHINDNSENGREAIWMRVLDTNPDLDYRSGKDDKMIEKMRTYLTNQRTQVVKVVSKRLFWEVLLHAEEKGITDAHGQPIMDFQLL